MNTKLERAMAPVLALTEIAARGPGNPDLQRLAPPGVDVDSTPEVFAATIFGLWIAAVEIAGEVLAETLASYIPAEPIVPEQAPNGRKETP